MQRPLERLTSIRGREVIVELRDNREMRGTLDGHDPHMNLVLRNAAEFCDGEKVRELDTVIVRGDSIVYISP